MTTPDTILGVEKRANGVAIITINRPERRNALNLDIKHRLHHALIALGDDAEARVIVLTGANGVFVAGTDIAEMRDMTPASHAQHKTDQVFHTLRDCAKPLIAAVEGYALGGGMELALACDLIVAGADARFGQPEIRVGIMPGAGATQILPRTIGKYRAMKLLLTGEPISAREALTMGLVSEVAETGRALELAVSLGETIAAMAPLAVLAIKKAVTAGQDASLSTGLRLERQAFQLLFDSRDQVEGMQAFLDKRAPVYRGE